MLTEEEFQKKYFAASTHIQKIQLFVSEKRYTIASRKDKPNLNGSEYVDPILGLPATYPTTTKSPRQSGGPGANFVVEVKYKTKIYGAEIELYLKCFYGPKEDLKLTIQSLRNDGEEK